jgi:flagellar basal body P-ring protein FlgI
MPGNMNLICRKAVLPIALLLAVYSTGGCGGRNRGGIGTQGFTPLKGLGETIGSLVKVIAPEPIPVNGFGLVVGLEGAGSAECPPEVRAYLRQYILKQLPAKSEFNVDEFINSSDTAVVSIEGLIPAIASRNQYFDVRVAALPSTQTTSLDGGRLLKADLRMLGSFGVNTRI